MEMYIPLGRCMMWPYFWQASPTVGVSTKVEPFSHDRIKMGTVSVYLVFSTLYSVFRESDTLMAYPVGRSGELVDLR